VKTLWLGLGSNIGNRAGHIRAALNELKPHGSDWIVAAFYLTAPRDMKSQPDFLNTVTRCTTELSAAEMLKRIHSIELKGGRRRASVPAKGPRTIDIDILQYGEDVGTWEVDGIGTLTIPHPSMHERLFCTPSVVGPESRIDRPQRWNNMENQSLAPFRTTG
jgi:2-amino-4-hydroxy-6-hydroxymethyldihydropteridine diphosphokinase